MTAAAAPADTDVDETEKKFKGDTTDNIVFKYVRNMFNVAVESPWPRYRLEVPDGNSTRTFLVAKPTFRARGLAGRGTRGYVALDCGSGKFVWLKDAWRAHYLLLDKEGDVVARLNKAHVKHVPTLVCHGDIADQQTLTPEWWEMKHPRASNTQSSASEDILASYTSRRPPSSSSTARLKRKRDDERSDDSVPAPKGINTATGFSAFREDCPLRLHRHYRLVEEEVGMPLSEFQNGRQLVSIVLNCLVGEQGPLISVSDVHSIT